MTLGPSLLYRIFLLVFVLFFGFVAFSLASAYLHHPSWLVAAFGLCCLVLAILGAVQLPNRSVMRITDESFSIFTVIGPQTYRWEDVSGFRQGPPANIFKSVSFDFAVGREPHGLGTVLTGFTRLVARSDRTFPNYTELRTAELVRLLNRRGLGQRPG